VNYEIIQLDELSGSKASIYSVLPEGEDLTLFDLFIEEYYEQYPLEIKNIVGLLKTMGETFGIREQLVKSNEGKPGDGVIALYDDPDKNLRLYGIRYGATILVLGSGGEKSKQIRAWQEDKKLKKEAEIVIQISADINQRIQDKEIEFSEDYTELTGNLNFTNHDND
jgi:putative component of toxin-antitoxin plasmid stabilization module